MEIFELLAALAHLGDACVCFLEMATFFVDGSAAYKGVKTLRERKKIAEKEEHRHGGKPLKKPSWWPFIILLVLGIGLTTLMIYKYTR